jgi:hypothetical protein
MSRRTPEGEYTMNKTLATPSRNQRGMASSELPVETLITLRQKTSIMKRVTSYEPSSNATSWTVSGDKKLD